ncbi:MAG: barstar family protein [Betaproteobacteria bacterium]|nr:barstar family protein [Betaproteobacteria bacterium]
MSPVPYEKTPTPERSGVYIAPDSLVELRAAAARAKLAWLELDATGACDKRDFLAACARDLQFPERFGGNWDALSDCLRDFGWRSAPGYIVRWQGDATLARSGPDAFATALEIFRDAANYWKERGTLFLVLLDEEPPGIDVPRLTGQ